MVSRAFHNARARLSAVACAADAWALFVRALAYTAGRKFGLKKLAEYDRKLTGKLAYRKLLPYSDGEKYDFGGIYLPMPAPDDYGNLAEMYGCFRDVLGVWLAGDDYNWKRMDRLDAGLVEGVYCYHRPEDGVEILVKKGDIVLDLGAWYGDFAAYASKKGATVYAFEPSAETRAMLEKTALYNKGNGGEIRIVPFGAGDRNETAAFCSYEEHAASSFFLGENSSGGRPTAEIKTVRLDDWARDESVRVDFIKADIEGFERNMLRGAAEILKSHRPVLSICTYHRPDDPAVLAGLILEANPEYRLIRRRMKLFAYVPGRG